MTQIRLMADALDPVRAHPAGPLLRRDQRVADGSVHRGRQEAAASDDRGQDGVSGGFGVAGAWSRPGNRDKIVESTQESPVTLFGSQTVRSPDGARRKAIRDFRAVQPVLARRMAGKTDAMMASGCTVFWPKLASSIMSLTRQACRSIAGLDAPRPIASMRLGCCAH